MDELLVDRSRTVRDDPALTVSKFGHICRSFGITENRTSYPLLVNADDTTGSGHKIFMKPQVLQDVLF